MVLTIFKLKSEAKNKDKSEPEYTVTVEYLDGKTETFKSNINYDEDTDRPYLHKENCEEVIPSQTKSITLRDSKDNVYKGIAENDRWYYILSDGTKVILYGKFPTGNHIKNLSFKFPDKPMVNYSFKNTETLMKDNPEAFKHIKKHRLNRIVSKVMLFGGLFLMSSPFLLPYNDEAGVKYKKEVVIPTRGIALGAGVLMSFSYLLFEKPQKEQLKKAVEAYNY